MGLTASKKPCYYYTGKYGSFVRDMKPITDEVARALKDLPTKKGESVKLGKGKYLYRYELIQGSPVAYIVTKKDIPFMNNYSYRHKTLPVWSV